MVPRLGDAQIRLFSFSSAHLRRIYAMRTCASPLSHLCAQGPLRGSMHVTLHALVRFCAHVASSLRSGQATLHPSLPLRFSHPLRLPSARFSHSTGVLSLALPVMQHTHIHTLTHTYSSIYRRFTARLRLSDSTCYTQGSTHTHTIDLLLDSLATLSLSLRNLCSSRCAVVQQLLSHFSCV